MILRFHKNLQVGLLTAGLLAFVPGTHPSHLILSRWNVALFFFSADGCTQYFGAQPDKRNKLIINK